MNHMRETVQRARAPMIVIAFIYIIALCASRSGSQYELLISLVFELESFEASTLHGIRRRATQDLPIRSIVLSDF